MQGDCKYISGRLYKVSRWLNYDLQWYLSAFFNNYFYGYSIVMCFEHWNQDFLKFLV